ncbi:MAG: ankyrin repeat domain-containing protein [Bryobacteraceae bacterium]
MSDLNSLHNQIRTGDLAAVRASLTQNPSLLDAVNGSGQNAFLLAKYYRQPEIAEYLLTLGPNLDLFSSCAAGWLRAVTDEIDRDGSLLEAHSGDGWTALHLAAFFGHPDIANALLDRGADVNARSTNSMKNTPLRAAVAGSKVELMRLMLKRGADANAVQEGGWTALHAAVQSGNREMVELLLAHEAHVNTRAENNQAALDLALTKGHQEIAGLLEELGAKLQ